MVTALDHCVEKHGAATVVPEEKPPSPSTHNVCDLIDVVDVVAVCDLIDVPSGGVTALDHCVEKHGAATVVPLCRI